MRPKEDSSVIYAEVAHTYTSEAPASASSCSSTFRMHERHFCCMTVGASFIGCCLLIVASFIRSSCTLASARKT